MAEGRVQLLDAGQLPVAGGVQLLAPAPELAVQETLGATEVREAHLGGVHRVQLDQGVDQFEDRAPGALRAERDELACRAVRGALDELHDVERGSEHLVVLAEEEGSRYRHVRRVQGADHPVLALHVVRGGQHMAERGRRTTHFAVPSVTA